MVETVSMKYGCQLLCYLFHHYGRQLLAKVKPAVSEWVSEGYRIVANNLRVTLGRCVFKYSKSNIDICSFVHFCAGACIRFNS